jgi:pSer/pThr/pTyr-binding forkhead associated (FHA) protein
MNLETILISAAVGIITSAITAYFTTRLRMKEEKARWRREFAMKYAEAQAKDNQNAQRMAVQFAIGVLIKNPETAERERIFVPPYCRLIAGRSPDNSIVLDDSNISRHHCAFDADDTDVYVEDLGSPNGIWLKGVQLHGRSKLETGDVVRLTPTTEFRFHKLDGH